MRQFNVRYQLKSDTEFNWNKAGPKNGSPGFVPLNGEMIIYQPDNTHSYSRVKIGDGSTNVVSLPFIDSGTLNGLEVEIVKASTRDYFPQVGSKDKLYIDLENNSLYHYIPGEGYSELLHFSITTTTTTAATITQWDSGAASTATIANHKITFTNSVAPRLVYSNQEVIKSISRGE